MSLRDVVLVNTRRHRADPRSHIAGKEHLDSGTPGAQATSMAVRTDK